MKVVFSHLKLIPPDASSSNVSPKHIVSERPKLKIYYTDPED